MTHRIYVDGQDGTTGLRIHEYLAQRQDVEVLRIAPELRKDAAERARLLNAADVAFLCLPDAASREAATMVTNSTTCLIDASTAFRTDPGWVYGLPELNPDQRDKIRASKRISNPGCHASSFILLLRPLIDAGLLSPHLAVSASSLTGYSGGGKTMLAQYEGGHEARLQSPRPYGLALGHKHIPEMMAHTGLRTRPLFMPIVGPFYKGLSVSVPLHLGQLAAGANTQSLLDCYTRRYASERFIRVLASDAADALDQGFFDVQACNDSNRVDIVVFGSADQVIVMARMDNLGKGASGAAVQAMNVHLELDEGLGL